MANSDVIVRIKADAQNYDANLAKATKTLDNFKKNNLSLGGIANQATSALTGMATSVMGVTAALGAAQKVFSSMVNINKQFEQSAATLASVLGQPVDKISSLTSQAKQLGATTRYTAMQILELQANLARLGFNQDEILNSTKAVQGMATAMGADLGEAANLAGAALRGFGLNATEMERVASVLSVGTTKSALSFEKLATALPVVQTAAAKTGFTIEDTVAMLGKLTDNGINAASAATQLRKILNDSTTAGTKLANALGGPVKSFDELVVALDKAGKAGQNHADSVALVNSKNATALDILRDMAQQREVDVNGVKKQTSALQKLRDELTDCAEGMRDMQRTQDDTLQGSIAMLNSAWEGLMLTFSESNGTIRSVVDALSGLLGAWTKWRKRNQGGDAAISTYELGGDAEKAQQYIDSKREEGIKDEGIKAQAEAEKEAIDKEIKSLMELEKLYAQYEAFLKRADYHNKSHIAENDRYLAQFKAAGYGGGNESRARLQQDIAARKDQSATLGLAISQVTPAKKTVDPEKEKEDNIKLLRAQYEAEIKENIAKLDRMKMTEEAYEEEVYKIKHEGLEKIKNLYQDETVEKARANAAISALEIQHQATMMRLLNKGSKDTKGAKGEDTFNPAGPDRSPLEKLQNSIRIQQADQASALDSTTLNNLLGVTVKNKISGLDADFSGIMAQMFNGKNIPDDVWQELADKINEKLKELNLDPIKLNVETGGVETLTNKVAEITDEVESAAAAFSALGNAMGQIKDPGAKVAGMIAEAIASIVSGYAAAVEQAGNGSAGGPWGWVAFAATGLATMIATIAGIKQATAGSYAEGGIIGGNSYSGDNMRGILPNGDIIGLNSGEVVLNAAQQSNLAGQLQSNPMGNLRLSTEISGSNLRVVLNNDNRSKGGDRNFYSKIH